MARGWTGWSWTRPRVSRPPSGKAILSQRLIDKDGWALLISTPRGKGWFYDLWRRGQDPGDPFHESWNYPSWSNPHLDRELIDGERERVPERVFRQEYLGEWIEGAGAVFRHVRVAATGEWRDQDPNARYSGGLDLARVEDYTVLVLIDDKRRVVLADRFHRLDWGLQVTRIKAALGDTGTL